MNLDNLLPNDKIEDFLKDHKRLFFMRICGTGMGACAALFKDAGFDVSGCDISFAPPMSDFLNKMNITCYPMTKVSDDILEDFDLIVVGNSVAKGSDLAKFIENSGLPFVSFPSLLGEGLLKRRNVLAVIGTHGKTTTAYFLLQILENLGFKPGHFIGGVIDSRSSSSLGEDSYFVIEGDEYDTAYFQKFSKFHEYFVKDVICTSLEFDHADIFENFEAVKAEFKKLFEQVTGETVFSDEYPVISELAPSAVSYRAEITEKTEALTAFTMDFNGEKHSFETSVMGEHNIQNIAGCLQLLYEKGIKVSNLKECVGSLSMVKRRQEERGSYKDAVVIDDFAHHPRAILETIQAVKQRYPLRKIKVVFEPISATARSNVFQDDFVESFVGADCIAIAETEIPTTAKQFEQLNGEKLVQNLNEKKGIPSVLVRDLESLLSFLEREADKQSLFLILSNRTCLGLWTSPFVHELH